MSLYDVQTRMYERCIEAAQRIKSVQKSAGEQVFETGEFFDIHSCMGLVSRWESDECCECLTQQRMGCETAMNTAGECGTANLTN